VIIKHIVELETIINEDSPEPSVKVILSMPEDIRNEFFRISGTEMIAELMSKLNVNEGCTWAELRVAQPR
jgi:hypothetical protein